MKKKNTFLVENQKKKNHNIFSVLSYGITKKLEGTQINKAKVLRANILFHLFDPFTLIWTNLNLFRPIWTI